MDEIRILAESALFAGIDGAEIDAMLRRLSPRHRRYRAGETLLRAGELALEVGLVLEGGVRVERVDAWGNRFILERFGPGEVFAEAYACVEGEPLLVDVVAAEACEALFLDTARVLSLGPTADACHARLVRNLLTEMAKKNLLLSRRIPPHCAAYHPRTPAGLSLRRGAAARHALVRHPLRPPAVGRLSGRGAQRPFGGTFQDAPRWPH